MGTLRLTVFTKLSEVTRGHGEEEVPPRLEVHPFQIPPFNCCPFLDSAQPTVLPYIFSHVSAQWYKNKQNTILSIGAGLFPLPWTVNMWPPSLLLFFPPPSHCLASPQVYFCLKHSNETFSVARISFPSS